MRWPAVLLAGLLAGALTGPAAAAPPAVERLRVEVLARYPHDPTAFTQGLELRDGVLYEGTGLIGRSELRTVDVTTGEVRERVPLPGDVFGEGITVVGDRIWQLTYLSEFAFHRDRTTLAEAGRVPYDGQGWGLCHDRAQDRLVMSTGRPELVFREPVSFAVRGRVAVTRDGQPLSGINELECVAGMVWANVWRTDEIVRIDPETGVVDAVVDAAGLLTDEEAAKADVLNGIAAVPGTDTFLITGKLWPWTFLVRWVPAAPA